MTKFPLALEKRIEDNKNHTRKGKMAAADGEVIAFRSGLELLLVIGQ